MNTSGLRIFSSVPGWTVVFCCCIRYALYICVSPCPQPFIPSCSHKNKKTSKSAFRRNFTVFKSEGTKFLRFFCGGLALWMRTVRLVRTGPIHIRYTCSCWVSLSLFTKIPLDLLPVLVQPSFATITIIPPTHKILLCPPSVQPATYLSVSPHSPSYS